MNTMILKQQITSKSAWIGKDLRDKSDWIYHLTAQHLELLEQALEMLEQKGLKAPYFNKQDFPIIDQELLSFIEQLSDELENGFGFFVLRGLTPEQFTESQLADIYYGIGLYLGMPVTQNSKGDLLGYVQNVGDLNKKDTRVYETNAYLPYHTDLSDSVGLLCIRKAKQGGLSSLVSAATIYNKILQHYPEYLSYYYYPTYCDHLGDDEPTLTPIFSYFNNKLSCRYLRAYIELGHERKNLPIPQVEKEALDIFDSFIHDPDLRLDMMLESGDIQFCNNYVVMHSRTSFEDDEDLAKRRKLLRLWLKMPNARELAPEFPGRNGIPQKVKVLSV